MPSVIHSNAALMSGLTAIQQTAIETATGLVTVQMTFAHRASNNTQLQSLFFVDAEPPVHPSIVPRANLLTGRLYMQDRSIYQENGLTYIEANYVGGLLNRGMSGMPGREIEGARFESFVSEPFSLTRQNPDNPDQINIAGNLTNGWSFTWQPIIITFEHVQVGELAEQQPTKPFVGDLYKLLWFEGTNWVLAPELGWSGIKVRQLKADFFNSILSGRGVQNDRKEEYLTPAVKVVTHRYFI